MAYGTTGAGTITKENPLLSIRRLSIKAATTLTKGEVCVLDGASGDLITQTTTPADGPHFVALETVVNSGSADDLQCPVAAKGHYVTVIADGVIEVGENVQAATSTAGQVIVWSGSESDEIVGVYTGKEGGSVAKAGTTPYAETFTDSADFKPVECADGDVIEILLGGM
jgi:hypothetical protein